MEHLKASSLEPLLCKRYVDDTFNILKAMKAEVRMYVSIRPDLANTSFCERLASYTRACVSLLRQGELTKCARLANMQHARRHAHYTNVV